MLSPFSVTTSVVTNPIGTPSFPYSPFANTQPPHSLYPGLSNKSRPSPKPVNARCRDKPPADNVPTENSGCLPFAESGPPLFNGFNHLFTFPENPPFCCRRRTLLPFQSFLSCSPAKRPTGPRTGENRPFRIVHPGHPFPSSPSPLINKLPLCNTGYEPNDTANPICHVLSFLCTDRVW